MSFSAAEVSIKICRHRTIIQGRVLQPFVDFHVLPAISAPGTFQGRQSDTVRYDDHNYNVTRTATR